MSTIEQIKAEAEMIRTQALIEANEKRARMRLQVQNALKVSRVLPLDSTIENPESVLKVIESLPNLTLHVSQSGAKFIATDPSGELFSVQQLVERALLADKALADGRSTKHLESADTVQELIRAKSDMSQTETMAYIDKYGLPAYERLPRVREVKLPQSEPEEMTEQEYQAMSLKQKVAFQNMLVQKYGSKWEKIVGQIHHRK